VRALIFLLFFNLLFALNVVEKDDIKQVDFKKEIAVLPNNDLVNVIKNDNLRVIGYEGLEKGLILVSKNSLASVKTVANPNLTVKIILKSIGVKYKEVNGTIDDFLNGKFDAIYIDEKEFHNIKNVKSVYYLNRFVVFPEKIIVGSKEYLDSNKKEVEKLKPKDPVVLFNAVMLTKFYLNSTKKFKDISYFKFPKAPLIKVVIDSYWPPFSIQKGEYVYGIGIDFWKLIAKKAELEYIFIKEKIHEKILDDIREKKADLTPVSTKTKEKEKFALFSKPYVSFPLAVVCRRNFGVDKIDEISTVAIARNSCAKRLMKKHYPYLSYIEVRNTRDALEMVRRGYSQCAVDIFPTMRWYLNEHMYHGLKVRFLTPFKFHLQVMVSKDKKDLLKKIDKAISSISKEEKDVILSKYNSLVIYHPPTNYNFIWGIVALGVVLILIYFLIKSHNDARMDALTEVLNRGAIEERFRKVLRKTNGSIIFMDIDHFKKINDTYGHDFGDFVLVEFAKIIRSHIRKSDYFGRYGGEEFLLILPNVSYEDALKVAEKLRKLVESYNFNGVNVTSSFGVTDFQKGESFEEVLKRADTALYEAKNGGRNRVVGNKLKKD